MSQPHAPLSHISDAGQVQERLDSALTSDVANDRESDFKAIFEGHYRSIHYFFASRSLCDEDCRDLTQETFFRAFRKRDTFRGEASIKTWLFQIATNIWRNTVRTETADKRKASLVSLEEVSAQGRPIADVHDLHQRQREGLPLDAMLTEERARLLHDALETLTPQMRRCVQFRICQDLKYREIAAIMQISIETVKSLLFQARQRLKEQLDSYFTAFDRLVKPDRSEIDGTDAKGK